VSYEGVSGLYTVFPTAKPPKASRSSGAGAGSGGRSSKRKKGRRAKATLSERALAGFGGIRSTARGSKLGVVDRLTRKAESRVTGIAGSLATAAGRRAAKKLKSKARILLGPNLKKGAGALLRSPVSKVATASFAGTLSAVALAGIASYSITTYILEARKRRKMDRAEQAAAAADAYRAARIAAAEKQGQPLTSKQQAQLAAIFKTKLSSLGLSTTNLRTL